MSKARKLKEAQVVKLGISVWRRQNLSAAQFDVRWVAQAKV